MKKVFILIILCIMFFGIYKINAEGNDILIKSVEVKDKSESAIVNLSDYEDLTINNEVSLYNLNDYVIYKIILKNNSDKDYKIESITDNNDNEYITYSYEVNDKDFKKDKEIELLVTLKYSKLVDRKTEGISNNLKITINYDNGESTTIESDSKDVTITNVEVDENPTTYDNIKIYLSILLISISLLVILIIKNKKLKVLGLILVVLLTIPTAHAISVNLNINIKSTLNLYHGYTITFDSNGGIGTMDNQIVFDDKVNISKCTYTKEAYSFTGWNTEKDGSGTSYNDEDSITIDKDITLYALWDNKLLYDVVMIDAESNNNAGKYVGEATDTFDEQGKKDIYYYTGSMPNNNVILGDYCWQMVRTTKTGGVKMIYNGTYSEETLYKYDKVSDKHLINILNDNENPYEYNSELMQWSSTNKTNYSTSILTFSVANAGDYVIEYLVSSEYNKDIAKVYIDDNEVDSKSGNDNGFIHLGNIDSSNVIKIEYTKNYYTSLGDDNFKFYIGTVTDSEIKNTCKSLGLNTTIDSILFNNKTANHGLVGYVNNENYNFDGDRREGLYGKSVTYSNGRYYLQNTKNSIDEYHHYGCGDGSDSCSKVRYYFYIGESGSYDYYELENGNDINNVLLDLFNSDKVNKNDSNIKTVIENWYSSNMINFSNYFEDIVFCNDRSIGSLGGFNPDGGRIGDYLYFGAPKRDSASLKCINVTDRFSVSNSLAKINYPIGLLTMDEAILGSSNTYQANNYLINGTGYWLGSPHHLDVHSYRGATNFANISVVSGNGSLYYADVVPSYGNQYGVRPVISLQPNTYITSGDGSKNNPYYVEVKKNIEKRYIYFEKPNEWIRPYAYLTGDIENTYPGKVLRHVKGNIYALEISSLGLSKNLDDINFDIQFNNGDSVSNDLDKYKYKLSTINFEGFDKVYKVTDGSTSLTGESTGNWSNYEDKEVLGRIYFNVPDSWNYPHAYLYRSSDNLEPLGSWPGISLNKYEDNTYYFEVTSDMIDDNITNYKVVFNNGGSNYNQSDASKKYKLSDVQLVGYDKIYNPLTNYESTSGNSTGEWINLE